MFDSPPLSTPSSSLSPSHPFLFPPAMLGHGWGAGVLRELGVRVLNPSFLCSIAPGASGLGWGRGCAVMGREYRELSVWLLLRCISASFLDFSSGCLLYVLKYLSPPIPKLFWGSTGFTGLPSGSCPSLGSTMSLFSVIYCSFIYLWTVWAFTCIVVLAKTVFLFSIIVMWYILRERRHHKTRHPVLHPCLAPSGFFSLSSM